MRATRWMVIATLAATLLAQPATAARLDQLAQQAAGQPHPLDRIARAIVDRFVPAEDDPDAICLASIAAARERPTSAASALPLEAVASALSDLAEPAQVVAALSDLLAAEPHGLTTLRAKELLRRLLLDIDATERAAALDAFGGYAKNWLAIGPFGDDGDYYNDVPFPPELDFPDLDSGPLQGTSGPLLVYQVRRPNHRSTVNLHGKGEFRPGCYYGLVQFEAARATGAYVEIVTLSSFELFVNGERLANINRYSVSLPSRITTPIQLAAGPNHILVKTTGSRHDDVALRVVDALSRPMSGVTEIESAHRVARQPLPAAVDRPEPPPPHVDGRSLLGAGAMATDPGANLRLLAHALSSFDARATDAGLESLFELDRRDANSDLGYAAALNMALQLPEDYRSSRIRRIVDAAPVDSPSHYLLTRRAGFLVGEDKIEEAIRLFAARVEANTAGKWVFERLDMLYERLDFDSQQRRLWSTWMSARPGDVEPTIKESRARTRGGDLTGAAKLIEAALFRRPGNRQLLREQLSLAVSLGRTELVESIHAKLHADEPDSVQAHRSRASALRRLGELDAAIGLYQRIATATDADHEDVRTAGNWLLRDGRATEAIAAFERSLELKSDQPDLRRTLSELRDQAEPFPLIARFRRDGDEIVAGFEPSPEREGSAPTSMLLDQMIVRWYPDGSRVREIHSVRRANDLSGVEICEQADAAAGADELVKLRTISAGPERLSFVPTRVSGTFSMPRLEPGAFVETVYRETRPAPNDDSWAGPMFYFQSESEPFLLSELVMILPPEHRGSIRSRRFQGESERIELPDGYIAQVFRSTNVPRLETERSTPALQELVPLVTYGSDDSNDSSARYSHIAATYRARPTPPIRAKTAELVDGLDSDLAKVQKLHEWVHATIPEGRGPADPTSILLRRQGPRFFLLASMLTAAGVPHRHAVVDDETEAVAGTPPSVFEASSTYDVPAVLIEPRDGPATWVFVDSPRFASLGQIPASRRGAGGLFLSDLGPELIRLPQRAGAGDGAGWRLRGSLELQPNGEATMQTEVELLGARGFQLADSVRELELDRRELIGRSLATQLFEGWTITASEVERSDPGDVLHADVTLRRREALQADGDAFWLELPITALEMFQNYGDQGERTLPYLLTQLTSEQWEVTIDPSESYRFVAIPEGVRVQSPSLDYDLSFRLVEGKLTIRRAYAIRPGRISAAEFADWVATLRRIDEAEKLRLKLESTQ